MHSAKEKVSNMASAAEEHVDIYKAKVEEKVEKAAARTKEEKDIAQELRKAKEAEAKMKLHCMKPRLSTPRINYTPSIPTTTFAATITRRLSELMAATTILSEPRQFRWRGPQIQRTLWEDTLPDIIISTCRFLC
ncbi:hypothetical protein CsSME_00044546 [Camellia sinensis var. sinensis]